MPDSAGKFRGISVSRVWPGHPDYEEAWEDLGRREAVRLCESIAQELAEERLTVIVEEPHG